MTPFRIAFLTRLSEHGVLPSEIGLSCKTAAYLGPCKEAMDFGNILTLTALAAVLGGVSRGAGKMVAKATTDDPDTFARRAKNMELAAAYRDAARRIREQATAKRGPDVQSGRTATSYEPSANAIYG